MMNLETQILDLFRKNVKKSRASSVCLESSFQKNLGLDSMRLVSILLQFEETFGIDVTEIDLDLTRLITIKDLVDITKSHIGVT